MELRGLRYFVTVAEELHFGRAAERLHIVQPAVSQQIARLEREFGFPLFDRSPRHVRLTAAGHRLLGAVRETLAAAERVESAAAGLRTGRTGTVRIGTGPGFTTHLERGVEALRRAYPGVEPVLVDRPVAERLDGVREGTLDFAVVRGVTHAPGLRVLPVWSEPLYAVLPGCHPLAGRPSVALAELAGFPFRAPSREADAPLYDLAADAFRAAGLTPLRGRPAGTVQDTLVEIGGGSTASWTLASAGMLAASAATRAVGVPLDPPLAVPGVLVAAEHFGAECARTVAAAFTERTPRSLAAAEHSAGDERNTGAGREP